MISLQAAHEIAARASIAACLSPAPLAAQTSTWTHQAPKPTADDLTDVQMLSPTEIWAVSDGNPSGPGLVIHSTDAGQTWEALQLGGGAPLWSLQFLHSQHGWAAGNGIYRTTDGGQTWSGGSFVGLGSASDIFFIDPLNGWAAGGFDLSDALNATFCP